MTTEARAFMDAQISEAEWQRQITDLADLHGWMWYFVRDSRLASAAGWPDLALVHPRRLEAHFWECKTQHGRVSRAQNDWLRALWGCGLNARVVRPADWPYVEAVLTGKETPA